MSVTRESAVRFFFIHAGCSWNPKTETRQQGRWACARILSAAEASAKAAGIWFDWRVSDRDSSDFSDEKPSWALWDCVGYAPLESGGAVPVESLSGCDFGRDRDPWTDIAAQAYARVVEAEIAAEILKSAAIES